MDRHTNNPNDNFAERLRIWRISQKLTQAEAAKLLDIDRAYLSQIERGRSPGKSLRTRFSLVEKSSSIKVSGYVSAGAYPLRNLPVLTWAQAGQTTDFEQIPGDWEEVVPSNVTDEHAFAVHLRGDSMEPRFSDGDIAVLLPGIPATNGETVVANLRDQGLLCKIMHVQLDKKLIKLSSYNPAYPPTEYHRDDFHWILPVATILKQLRQK